MRLNVAGKEYEVEFLGPEGDAQIVSVNGHCYAVTVTDRGATARASSVSAVSRPAAPRIESSPVPKTEAAPVPPARTITADAGERIVKAPMPGTVLQVNAMPGQSVAQGQVLLVLESMKMENAIPSPVSGQVVRVMVEKGGQVASGDALVVIRE